MSDVTLASYLQIRLVDCLNKVTYLTERREYEREMIRDFLSREDVASLPGVSQLWVDLELEVEQEGERV